jgi:hypothetical protein
MSQFLRDYFYASGDSNGIPLEELQVQAYQELLRVRIFYDWPTDDLMEASPSHFKSPFELKLISDRDFRNACVTFRKRSRPPMPSGAARKRSSRNET